MEELYLGLPALAGGLSLLTFNETAHHAPIARLPRETNLARRAANSKPDLVGVYRLWPELLL